MRLPLPTIGAGPSSRVGAFKLPLLAFAIFSITALFLSPHQQHRLYALLLPSPTVPSGWFNDAGYLRLNYSDPWSTTYETRAEAMEGYACDEETVTDGGAVLCQSKIRLYRAMRDNSAAQLRVSQAALDGKVGAEGDADAAILEASYAETKRLRGKRVLYLGDSVDRIPVDELAAALPTSTLMVHEPISGDPLDPKDNRANDHTTRFVGVRLVDCPSFSPPTNITLRGTVRPDEFRMDFLFTYGVYDSPAHDEPPSDFLERVDLLGPLLGEDTHYDLIVLNAGLWDLMKFYRNNEKTDVTHGVLADWLDAYINRFILVVERLRVTYGSRIPIAIRLTHDTTHTYPEHKAQFIPLRSEHMRQAQRELARRLNLRILPFADRMRGQAAPYLRGDGYHPSLTADTVLMEMVLRMVAET